MYLSELKPLQKNPFKSRGDKQIAAIGRSIQEFEKMMEIRKIVIDEEFNILGGNKRYFALKALGRAEIPDSWVDQVSGLTEAQKREFIVKDNAHWGSEWDFDLLNDWGVDLEDWGIIFQSWEKGMDENNMTDDDVDLEDEFDPIGSSTNLHKVVFIFNNEQEAETFMSVHHRGIKYKKFGGGSGKIYQVNLSTNYGKK